MNKTKMAGSRRPRPAALDRKERSDKIVVSGIPGFLVRLVGWRRLGPALNQGAPEFRHD